MPQRPPTAALLSLLLALSGIAAAEPPAAEPAATEPATAPAAAKPAAEPAAAKPAAATKLRRDPKGIKGISPFREALSRGDQALLARDFDAALAAYREALSTEPQNALGHYRLGEAQLLKGDLLEAESAFSAGLRVVTGESLSLKAKLEFALSDLRERQKAYDEASAKWAEYEAFTSGEKPAPGFPASAVERKKVIETWKKLSADSLAVKARIEKGMKAADEAVRKSSQ